MKKNLGLRDREELPWKLGQWEGGTHGNLPAGGKKPKKERGKETPEGEQEKKKTINSTATKNIDANFKN